MAQDNDISQVMGWFWTAIGVIGTGIVGLVRWLLKSRTEIESIKDDISDLAKDIEEIKLRQKKHDIRHEEVIEKIEESSKFLASEFRKSNEKMRDYFDDKYKTLETRIYEQKK